VVRAAVGDDVEPRTINLDEDVAREAVVRRLRRLGRVRADEGRRVEGQARGGAGAGVEHVLVAAPCAAAEAAPDHRVVGDGDRRRRGAAPEGVRRVVGDGDRREEPS
jgi:hypothetical protein